MLKHILGISYYYFSMQNPLKALSFEHIKNDFPAVFVVVKKNNIAAIKKHKC